MWDLDELPDGVQPSSDDRLLDPFFELGPFGFRGPAASHIAPHLTFPDGDVLAQRVA